MEGRKRRPQKKFLKWDQYLLYKVCSASDSISVTSNMFSLKCLIFATVAVAVLARSAPASQNSVTEEEAPRSQDTSSYFGDFRYMYKVYQECAATDLSSCLKLKLVAAMDRAAKAYPQLTLFEGVSFVKEGDAKPEASTTSEADIEASLPRSLDEKDQALNSLIADKVSNFFQTHTLQVNTYSIPFHSFLIIYLASAG